MQRVVRLENIVRTIFHIFKTINFSLLLLLIIILNVFSAPNKYHFALVLSGGGARGLAQIGVIKAFEEAHIQPDLIVATSMGAIVAGLYASGYSSDSMAAFVKSTDWDNIFSNISARKKRFVSQKSEPSNYLFELRFEDNFKPVLPNSISFGQAFYDQLIPRLAISQFRASMNFDSLPIPLRIVTTDILSGKKVVFSKGNLVESIRASCGVPLAFSPVEIDTMLLMDGGLSSNIPVETAIEEGAEFVVAVDVTSPVWKRSDLENPVKLVDQIVSIGITKQKETDRNKADILITPNLGDITNTQYKNIDSIIQKGYEAAVEKISILTNRFNSITVAPVSSNIFHILNADSTLQYGFDSLIRCSRDSSSSGLSRRKFDNFLNEHQNSFCTVRFSSDSDTGLKAELIPGIIKHINITGNRLTSSKTIITASGLKIGDTLSNSLLQKSVSSIYSTDLFDNVNIDMDTLQNVRIIVKEKNYWRTRMGLRFDEFHLGEGFIQPAYENLFGMGICIAAHLQYGLRREKYALEFTGNHLLTTNLANTMQMQFYFSKEMIFQRDIIHRETGPDSIYLKENTLRKTGLVSSIGAQIGRFTQLTCGFKLERFKVQQSDRGNFGDIIGINFEEGLPYLMLKLTIDSMDKFPFPTTGWKDYFTFGGTSHLIGSSSDFMKFDGSFGRYLNFAKRNTICLQIRFAFSSSHLPEVEQVYLGGAIPEERYREMSIYNYVPFVGLQPRAVPGDIMELFHFDYRFQIKKHFYAQLDLDWGNAWEKNEYSFNNSFRDLAKESPAGIGLSLFYESILGPIRVTYGQLLNDVNQSGIKSEGMFYFSAGHDF